LLLELDNETLEVLVAKTNSGPGVEQWPPAAEPLRSFGSQKPCKAIHYKPQESFKVGAAAYHSFTHVAKERDGIRIRPRTGNEISSKVIRGLHPKPTAPHNSSLTGHADNFLCENEYGALESQAPRNLSSLRAATAYSTNPNAPVPTHNNFFTAGAPAAGSRAVSPPSAASYHTSVRSSFVHKQRQLHIKRASASSTIPTTTGQKPEPKNWKSNGSASAGPRSTYNYPATVHPPN